MFLKEYADLLLKKHFWLLSMLKTVVLLQILWTSWYITIQKFGPG